MLTWKRDKVTETHRTGGAPVERTFTTHTTTLPNGTEIMLKSVEGSFFFYKDGQSTGGFENSLREAKARIEKVAEQMERIA